MNFKFNKLLCAFFSIFLIFSTPAFAENAKQVDTDISANLINSKSGILIEASTGEVLYELNPDEKLNIASVTKTMTMLLTMEALDSGKIKTSDIVTVSEHASSMGGSQVYLETNEKISVDDLLKAIAVSSGNDAAVAMAEFISGSEPAFIEKMNKRAEELNCKNTHFINCNGLDETADHYSTARDVATISRELLKHEKIFDYTTIWMDSIRNGKFGLSNTNKLIRFYEGANGIKTGSTSTAKYCISASAKRDNMQLIAVILGAPTTKDRFSSANSLLDFGFANYEVLNDDTLKTSLPYVNVVSGKENKLLPVASGNGFIIKKGNSDKIEQELLISQSVNAPIEKGQKIGEIIYKIDGDEITRRDVVANEDIKKINIFEMFLRCLGIWARL